MIQRKYIEIRLQIVKGLIMTNEAVQKIENINQYIKKLKNSVHSVIIGQDNVVDLCLCSVLASSHALLVGMPGLAKTSLVNAIAHALNLDFSRIQFTPDLMPADILGSEILETAQDGSKHFRFVKGPVFTQILMADEINRASPKTQSALLQAMAEKEVSIAGQNFKLPSPFHVLATQNPIEHEGAYPLPEAQLDRFLLQINVPYPDEATEREILLKTTSSEKLEQIEGVNFEQLVELQNYVLNMPLGEKFVNSVLGLVRNLRPETTKLESVKTCLEYGPSPRAGQALILASKARAAIMGKASPSLDDLYFVANSALIHRMALNWQGRANNIKAEDLIKQVFDIIG